jgi:hypothetical protein
MADFIGRITVPEIAVSATPFPLVTDFQHGRARKRSVVVHPFADLSGKFEQRFFFGPAAARYVFKRSTLKNSERKALAAFFDAQIGSGGSFLYNVPQEDQSFVPTLVHFEDAPLTLDSLADHISSTGVTMVEIPTAATAPDYPLAATDERFPAGAFASALLGQEQDIIPLVRIRVLDPAVPDIFLSDRRVTIGGQLYLPRILNIGDTDSSVLVSQTIEGGSDAVSFTFGNADRVMIQLANDTQLIKARLELSFYSVQSQTKLDLWAGEVTDWSSDQGPEFSLSASDIITALTLQSPAGNISRTCWRIYANQTYGCPIVKSANTLDTTHFPGASMDFCDLGYETANGCLAHTAAIRSFGGQVVKPQVIQIRDGTTGGLFGFGQKLITPTSQVADSIYDGLLAEIWHHDDGIPEHGLKVECRVADGREESDFYDALGIVGRGPLGAFTTAAMYDSDDDGIKETFLGATLDGQPHHGFQQTDSKGNFTDSLLGYRFALGDDPANPQDYFSLGRVGTTATSWREVVDPSGLVFEQNYAAGVAFLEIRRTDQKGVQPSAIASHQMTAMVSRGLTGLLWSGPGGRTELQGLTDPFWVCINTFFRSMGITTTTTDFQEQFFDVNAAVACSAVANQTVASLMGAGSETQFRFKGTLDARVALRDRLTEILNNCLGYYTWSFGKLKLGIRTSAAPETSFSAANMLWQSLKFTPTKPTFEKLTVSFADEEFLQTKNTVDYTDQDFALRNNRVQNPLTRQMGLIGSSTKSQAARLAVVRTREELGGVGVAEQTNARNVTWKSTILGIGTQAGTVVGIVDPEVPGGTGQGAFRIKTWTLHRDYSLSFEGSTVTPSMYDLTVGSVAVDVGLVKKPTQAQIDLGPPPAPIFEAVVAPDDPGAAEILHLTFPTTPNTRTITSGTFTLTYHDPADPTTVLTKAFQTSFAYDLFTVDPITGLYSINAQQWMMKAHVPGAAGMVVTQIDGYVTNRYGDSPVTSLPVSLELLASADHWVFNETPAGVMDGTNPVFTTELVPDPPESLRLDMNGILQLFGIDFLLEGNVITFQLEPGQLPNEFENDWLRCTYKIA